MREKLARFAMRVDRLNFVLVCVFCRPRCIFYFLYPFMLAEFAAVKYTFRT